MGSVSCQRWNASTAAASTSAGKIRKIRTTTLNAARNPVVIQRSIESCLVVARMPSRMLHQLQPPWSPRRPPVNFGIAPWNAHRLSRQLSLSFERTGAYRVRPRLAWIPLVRITHNFLFMGRAVRLVQQICNRTAGSDFSKAQISLSLFCIWSSSRFYRCPCSQAKIQSSVATRIESAHANYAPHPYPHSLTITNVISFVRA